jgi:hypothetical protein
VDEEVVAGVDRTSMGESGALVRVTVVVVEMGVAVLVVNTGLTILVRVDTTLVFVELDELDTGLEGVGLVEAVRMMGAGAGAVAMTDSLTGVMTTGAAFSASVSTDARAMLGATLGGTGFTADSADGARDGGGEGVGTDRLAAATIAEVRLVLLLLLVISGDRVEVADADVASVTAGLALRGVFWHTCMLPPLVDV